MADKNPSIFQAQQGGAGGLVGLTGIKGSSSNPLALTGMSQGQLAAGSMGSGFSNPTPQPTDMIGVGRRAAGVKPGIQGPGLDVMSYNDAQGLPGQWYTNDRGFYNQFLNKLIMYKYPGASSDMGMAGVMSAWDDLLKMSITLNKSTKGGKATWTPWDILDSYNRPAGSLGTYKSGDWLIDAATNEKVKYIGPKTKTSSQTAFDLSNAEQVQAVATDALTKMIGRAPTDKELAQFKATLNGYEREHPELTTTTEHYDDMGNVVASDVVHSGGVTDAARAEVLGKGVQKTKEYAKYQSGTTYFNALMQMIGGG